jgi:uncharacterized membrane protein
MTEYKVGSHTQKYWTGWRLVMTGLNIIALVLSIILSWHFLKGGSMIGCGGGSPCEQVLNSRWSSIGGIPISGLAVGVYLALLVTWFFTGPSTEASVSRLARSVMLILAGSIAASAIWFTVLQKWVIGSFCPWCMTTHITGFILAILIIVRAITETDIPAGKHRSVRPAISPVLAGMALTAILAAFQVIFTPAPVYKGGKSLDNIVSVDYHNVPIKGSPDAPYIVTLLFDYECSHCQKMHFLLDEVIRRYSGKLAFVLCPAPLNPGCNPFIPREADAFKNSCELARIGLTVWRAKRETFPDFENWMFSFESGSYWLPRNPEEARRKAIELAGKENFEAAWSDPWVEQYMQSCVQIYGRTIQDGKGGVPRLVFGDKWILPELYNADDLIVLLQESLGVPKP